MRLTVVIPAYNEVRRLPGTLAALAQYLDDAPGGVEVIVVDDGSTDDTAAAARAVPVPRAPARVIRRERNGGKGAAVREGLLAARGDYVLLMDADQSTPVAEIDRVLEVAGRGAPVVNGSRYLEPGSITERQPWYRVAVSRAGNFVIRHVVLPGIKDTQCGFKLLRRDAAVAIANRMTMRGFSFDIELLALARQLGYGVVEVPVHWHDSPGTRLRVFRASVRTLWDLTVIRRRLGRAQRAPVQNPVCGR